MTNAGKCRILTVANSKGGVGKSTLATNLAVEAAVAGLKVLLVDADPQASSALFAATRPPERPEFRIVQMTQAILHREIPALAASYDLAILDTSGRENKTLRSALTAAQTIVVPVVPSAYDLWASEDVLELIDELTVTGEDTKTWVLLNLIIPRTRIAREALEALHELLAEQNAHLLASRIHARVAWKMASSAGLGVSEWEPGGAAASELRTLVTELGIVPKEQVR